MVVSRHLQYDASSAAFCRRISSIWRLLFPPRSSLSSLSYEIMMPWSEKARPCTLDTAMQQGSCERERERSEERLC